MSGRTALPCMGRYLWQEVEKNLSGHHSRKHRAAAEISAAPRLAYVAKKPTEVPAKPSKAGVTHHRRPCPLAPSRLVFDAGRVNAGASSAPGHKSDSKHVAMPLPLTPSSA